MRFRIVPTFEGNKNVFIVQKEHSIFGLRYWADMQDSHRCTYMIAEENLQDAINHLTKCKIIE